MWSLIELFLCFYFSCHVFASNWPNVNTVREIEPLISFDEYFSHDQINEYLDQIATTNPDIAQVETIGKSFEGRDLKVLKLNSDGGSKPVILIDGGFHAREWITTEMVLFIIDQLVTNENNAQLLNGAQWHLLPLGNPDGYEYTRNPTGNRYWKKTRSLDSSSTCPGVDTNRNWDFHWMDKIPLLIQRNGPKVDKFLSLRTGSEPLVRQARSLALVKGWGSGENEGGASDRPCDSMFAGPKPFSENETISYQKYTSSLPQIQLYLTFHSYGGDILYPWGYTTELPENWQDLDDLAQEANKANVAAGGQNWRIGSYMNVHYASAGNSADYMHGVLQTPYTYTLQMPGWDYIVNPSEILEQVTPVFEMVRVFATHVINKY